MKRHMIGLALVAALGTSTAFAFGLGNVLPGSSSSSSSVSAADIDKFVQDAQTAAALVRGSATQLALAVSSKEEQDKILALVDANKKAESADEKAATTKKLDDAIAAELKGKDFEKSKEAEAAGHDANKKKAVANSSFNLLLGMLKDKALVDQGSNIISGAGSNLTLASKLGAVKDAVATTKDQLSNFGSVATNLPKLFKKTGVTVAAPTPTKADDKPHDTDLPA